jgi:hypothetical protein
MSKHPIQPLELDQHGTLRFKANKIIRQLVDTNVINLNDIACMDDVDKDDQNQFAQLIGYSLSGYGSLSYADDYTYATAHAMHKEQKSELEARLAYLEDLVANLKTVLREPVADLYGMHPSDLPE